MWWKPIVVALVFEVLAQEADNEYAMIDSTIVRAHQHSAGVKGGMQTGKQLDVALVGLSTKIHAVVDEEGKSGQLSPHARTSL